MSDFNRATRILKKITLKPRGATDVALEIIDPSTGLASYSLTGAGTESGDSPVTIDTANAAALAVGPNGTTNPTLLVDTATASTATGIEITGAAAASGVAVAAISSGTNENLTIDAKGSGTITLGGTSTGAITLARDTAISGAINYKKQVTDTGGVFATPIVLTEAQSGRVIRLDDAAGLDFTLPAISASNIGMHFKFVATVSVSSNSYRMTAGAADLLKGGVLMVDFDDAYTAPQGVFLEPDGTDDLIMTMNGTTTGGKAGSWVEFTAVSATEWFVSGIVAGDGVLATPFS